MCRGIPLQRRHYSVTEHSLVLETAGVKTGILLDSWIGISVGMTYRS